MLSDVSRMSTCSQQSSTATVLHVPPLAHLPAVQYLAITSTNTRASQQTLLPHLQSSTRTELFFSPLPGLGAGGLIQVTLQDLENTNYE